MMNQAVVVHYSEIGLKGRNRPFFENQLRDNIRHRLDGMGLQGVRNLHGRFLVILEPQADVQAVLERLRTVPGIAYFAPAFSAPREPAELKAAVSASLPRRPVRSFRVDTRRADKAYPLTSEEVNVELGAHIQAATGWPVDLRAAELTVSVEILARGAIVYFERHEGVGGLPVGSSGTAGLLLSGGIDSPVAGYYALKRGCRVVAIHFHSGPFGAWLGSEDKVRRLVEHLGAYGLASHYYVVPIGEVQREIVLGAPGPARVLLYRRLMLRVAQVLTLREGGLALVTGENLGQVASQTLQSLRAVEAVAGLPVLRPVIGFDKQEIIAQAQAIGTYELSVEASDDCCQFLVPRQVLTRPSLAEVDAAEAGLDVEHLVTAALQSARVEKLSPPFP